MLIDSSGTIYISDTGNSRVRKVVGGTITTIAGGNGWDRIALNGDGGLATSAEVNQPRGLALNTVTGDLYIADSLSDRIRKITAITNNISTVAGLNTDSNPVDGTAISAELLNPQTTAAYTDASGSRFVYITDTLRDRIRRINPDGTITTIAGTGQSGFSGEGGPATSAQLNQPSGIALDATGNLYIADSGNNRIRRVAASDQTISTIAGTGF